MDYTAKKSRELIFKTLINAVYIDGDSVTIAYNFTESDGTIAQMSTDSGGSSLGTFGGDEGNRTPVRKYVHTNFSECSH